MIIEDMMMKAENGRPCIIDKSGRILVKPDVDVDTLYYPGHEFFCPVEKDGKYGYINSYGVLQIPLQYKMAYPFSENGLAFVVCENGLGGYIDIQGRFVIEPKYETGSAFKFGMAAVSIDGEYKFIYKNDRQAINQKFKYASGFSECGLAVIQEFDGTYGLIDTTSRSRLKLKEGCVLEDFKEDSRITKFRKNGKEALINAAGDIITPYYDQIIISPYARLNPFLRDGLWGFMDIHGEEIIPNIYLEVSEFHDNVALVKAYDPLSENNYNTFYINENDEIVDTELIESKRESLNEQFFKVNNFIKGIALAEMKVERNDNCDSNDYHLLDETVDNITFDEYEYTEDNLKGEYLKKFNITVNSKERFDEYSVLGMEIFFKNKKKKKILKFLKKVFNDEVEIIKLKNHYVKIAFILEPDLDEADYDIVMYDELGDGEKGTYRTFYIAL